jgi:uncharacterized double-CXXCG motif protein
MRVFKLEEPMPENGARYTIEGKRQWRLPGVNCANCGAWGMGALSYPSLKLPKSCSATRYELKLRPVPNTPVSPDVLEELRAPLKKQLPPDAILPPATGFGRFTGKARGRLPDFAWSNGWTLFIRAQQLHALQREGVRGLEGFPIDIKQGSRQLTDLLELEGLPVAALARESLPKDGAPPCAICGRRAITGPKRIIIEGSSILADRDLFRGLEMVTWFFATERFVSAVERLRLRGLLIKEVEVNAVRARGKTK